MATTNNNGGKASSGTTGTESGGGRAASAYQSARDASSSALGSTTRAVTDTARYTGRKISDNPVGALVGGFAVGAVLGAMIPATRRERDALAPLGGKINDAARAAARQAAEAGRDKLNSVTGQVVTQVGAKMVDAVAPPADA
jgi:hypothetical protein